MCFLLDGKLGSVGIMKALRMKPKYLFVACSLLFAGAGATWSEIPLSLADIFGDHMVLQRAQALPIWGTAEPEATVEVTFGDQQHRVQADATGAWKVMLAPLKKEEKPQQLVLRSGEQTLECNHVLVGEVWYSSGQSNMAMQMRACAKILPEAEQLLNEADYPLIRYRAIKAKDQWEPQTAIGDGKGWTVCTPDEAGNYSAVSFVFARRLHLELGVPIGIIESAWGGHPIEPFIPREAFTGHPVLETIRTFGDRKDLEMLKALTGGVFARNESWLPGTIYNTRVAPVVPYGLRGVIWYQAESNCGKEEDPRFYAEKMEALIRGWRAAWNKPTLPFYYVQLPQYDSPGWVPMRDEQRRAMQVPHTGMAVTIDLALDQIHPANKIDVGERLALWPLKHEYGREVVPSGPQYKSMAAKGSEVFVRFDALGGGLCTGKKKDLHPTEILPGKVVHGFELCNKAGDWFPAEARIMGNQVRCESAELSKPVAVRYAWATVMPEGQPWNLYNRAGLPASPFVSDAKWAPYNPFVDNP